MTDVIDFKGFLSFLILHEISYRPLTGKDLAIKIGRRKNGKDGRRLSPGTIYPALKRLRNDGLVTYTQIGKRKLYELTEDGEDELDEAYKKFSRHFYGLKNKIRREYSYHNY